MLAKLPKGTQLPAKLPARTCARDHREGSTNLYCFPIAGYPHDNQAIPTTSGQATHGIT